jgi:ubiquinone/menaquinone biosynthesis C-methylase UbiE
MDFHDVYDHGAEGYDALVRAEDVDGNLLPAVEAIMPLAGRRVVEVGAGTGRVTRLLARSGAEVVATEPAGDMVRVGAAAIVDERVHWCRASAAALPLADEVADAAVAGWVLAHQREWEPTRWQETVSGFLHEMHRVVRPGGTTVLIETLGTGFTEPTPTPELAGYYDWLQATHGFRRTWIRTDYQFDSVDGAARVTGAFFGPEFAATVRANGWTRVPECTGIWWRS